MSFKFNIDHLKLTEDEREFARELVEEVIEFERTLDAAKQHLEQLSEETEDEDFDAAEETLDMVSEKLRAALADEMTKKFREVFFPKYKESGDGD